MAYATSSANNIGKRIVTWWFFKTTDILGIFDPFKMHLNFRFEIPPVPHDRVEKYGLKFRLLTEVQYLRG